MKIIILGFLFLLCGYIKAESDQGPLDKYSYLVLHFLNGKNKGNSTGFFIKKQGQLFFITTYHTCACVNVFTKELNTEQWDSLHIRLATRSKNIAYYIINLKSLQEHRVIDYFFNHPDICIYKINNMPDSIVLNSIDGSMDLSKKITSTPNRAILFGYPNKPEGRDASKVVPTEWVGQFKYSIHYSFQHPKSSRPVTTVYVIQPATVDGESGAPVFFQYFKNDGSIDYTIFGGMVSGTASAADETMLVKSSLILSDIDKLE